MAKCKMKRIEIAALLSDSKKIVERLQRRGVVEICDNTDEELVRLNTQAMIGVFEKNLNLAEQAKEIMARYVPVKTGLFDSLRGRRELTTEAFGKQVEQAERMLKKCYDIVSLEKQIHDASEEMIRQRTQMDALEPWRKLDVSMAAALQAACPASTPLRSSRRFYGKGTMLRQHLNWRSLSPQKSKPAFG